MVHQSPKVPAPQGAASQADKAIAVLGKTRTAVGLGGWVKVQSYTDPPDNILDYATWQLHHSDGWRPLKVQQGRMTNQGVQVQFVGITDRTAAEALRNLDIGVFRRELPPTAPGEYYWDDLLGLDGYTSKGESLGKLDHFLETPAHPLMVFRARDEGGTVDNLVPATKGRIVEVDFAAGRLTLDWTLDWVADREP